MGKRNPNGYGSVTKLSGRRSRPWVIKVTVYDADGRSHQKPVDYAETEAEANILLAQYNNNPWNIERSHVTLAELYKRWNEIKAPKLGTSNRAVLRSAYGHLSKYYGVKYRSLRAYQMQETIDNCGRSASTQSSIKVLWGHLDNFAYEQDIIDKQYSILTTSPPAQESTRTPFSTEQIEALWALLGEPWVDTVLIYIYTGFWLRELLEMRSESVNLEDWYLQGGLKTAAGRGRIVPIHERIKPLVQARAEQGYDYLFVCKGAPLSPARYRQLWEGIMKEIGAEGKTPHEARHTFETLLDNAGGNRKCIDLLMGHKSKDVGNRIYNHKTLDQLRETINLIK